jgi:hypothetical protein
MTLPASWNSASERALSSEMEANACTDLRVWAGSGCAAETAMPTATIVTAPARSITRDRMLPPYALAAA